MRPPLRLILAVFCVLAFDGFGASAAADASSSPVSGTDTGSGDNQDDLNLGLTEVRQPDGTKLWLHAFGADFFTWYEDDWGFTIVLDEDGKYVYATLGEDGELGATEMLAGQFDQ